MLDFVKSETERIDSRFLEPACGNGNFLAEVLTRKLQIVSNRYQKSQMEYERYSILAISSIYGVDILEDNVGICRNRLLGIFEERYFDLYGDACKEDCKASARFLLERNIIWGDALTLNTVSKNPEPIVFSEWAPVNGSLMKRRDFKFSHLLAWAPLDGPNLFSDLGEDVFIPEPVREFPLVHFLKLSDAY